MNKVKNIVAEKWRASIFYHWKLSHQTLTKPLMANSTVLSYSSLAIQQWLPEGVFLQKTWHSYPRKAFPFRTVPRDNNVFSQLIFRLIDARIKGTQAIKKRIRSCFKPLYNMYGKISLKMEEVYWLMMAMQILSNRLVSSSFRPSE